MHAAAAAKSCQLCPTLCDPIDGSPPGSHPWDSPGKNTGVGCHFLLQCMKVKNESEVTQSCLTLCDPMDCSRPWDFPGKSIGVGCHCLLQFLHTQNLFFFLMKSQYACLPVQMTTAERRVKWELLGSTSQTYQTSTHFIVIKQKKIVAPSLLI